MSFQVLVLDDDKYMAGLMKTLLSEVNCSVVWARTGTEATEKINTRKFDLAIVDFRLPDCDGMSWMSDQRRAGCNIPFIFLSGIPMTFKYQTRLRNLLKVDSVLQKPVEPAKFLEIVSTILEQNFHLLEPDENFEQMKTRMNEKVASGRKPEESASPGNPIQFNLESCLQSMAQNDELDLESDDVLDQEIYQLKLEYLEDLPSLLRDLADKLDDASNSGWTQEEIYKAMLAAHSIKGTSASLSIERIPEIFSCIEEMLKEMHENFSVNEIKNETIVL